MSLCGYETSVLRKIAAGEQPDDPGAAWWAACEVLGNRGYIEDGKPTPKGYKELRLKETDHAADD